MSRRPPFRIVLVLGFCAVLAPHLACQKRDEGSGKAAPIPPLDPASAPAAPPPAAPLPPAAEPAAAAPAPAAAAGGSITGKIVLSGPVAKSKPQGTLYLLAGGSSDNATDSGTL